MWNILYKSDEELIAEAPVKNKLYCACKNKFNNKEGKQNKWYHKNHNIVILNNF